MFEELAVFTMHQAIQTTSCFAYVMVVAIKGWNTLSPYVNEQSAKYHKEDIRSIRNWYLGDSIIIAVF